jgi:hypothetical protein
LHAIDFVVEGLKFIIWSYTKQFNCTLFTHKPDSYVNKYGQVIHASLEGDNTRQLFG